MPEILEDKNKFCMCFSHYMLILIWKDSPPALQQNTAAPLPDQSEASDFQSLPNIKR